jgi:hypothetical protein
VDKFTSGRALRARDLRTATLRKRSKRFIGDEPSLSDVISPPHISVVQVKLSISLVGPSISAMDSAGPLLVKTPSLEEVVRAAGARRRVSATAARGATSRKRAAARRTDERSAKATRRAR